VDQTSHGFFYARRQLNLDLPDAGPALIDYPNMPRTIGTVVSTKMATLHELDTVYSMDDLYDMLEVIAVDAHNRRKLAPKEG